MKQSLTELPFAKPKRKRTSLRWERIAPGVRRYPDGREVCSPVELNRRKWELFYAGENCLGCGEPIRMYEDFELAHKNSKGHGGAKRDDSYSNLGLMHTAENREQGSRSLEQYRKDKGYA